MARKRVRREPPARRGPVRNAVVRSSGDLLRSTVDGGVEAVRESAQASSAAVQGAVENTVATAYALSDQMMTRGYSAASLYSRSDGDPTMSDSGFRGPGGEGRFGPFGRQYGAGPGADRGSDPFGARGPMSFWMEPWLQMMRFWTDSLYMMSSTANPMNPISSVMGMGGNPGMSVEVQSVRPARVTLDLAPGADFEQLSVAPLVLEGAPEADTLDGVTVSARPGQYGVRVEVEDTQAPGMYVGAVEGPGRRPLGEVRVEIIGAAKKRRAPAKKKVGRGASKKSADKK